MLTGARAVALGAFLSLAGCLGSGGDPKGLAAPMSCLLGGPPQEPPPHREPFNLTDEHVERFPVLASLFGSEAHLAPVACDDGVALLRALQSEGADVVFRDQAAGHDAYLSYGGATLHVVLTART